MAETHNQNCKFVLLRYVPDAVKGEFVNIGLMLLPPQGRPELRFDKNWTRLQTLYPQADLELLEAFRDELLRESIQEAAWERVLARMQDSFSNALQASEYKACLTPSPVEEADKLAGIYLEGPKHPRGRERSARQDMREQMKRAFERTGAWPGMKHDIPISLYTGSGDPLVIDCGYGHKSAVKLFHATPVKNGVNGAKALAFSFPAFARGIRDREGQEARLTAIVEDDLDGGNAAVAFALDALAQQSIGVAGMAELPQLAELAARELGV